MELVYSVKILSGLYMQIKFRFLLEGVCIDLLLNVFSYTKRILKFKMKHDKKNKCRKAEKQLYNKVRVY